MTEPFEEMPEFHRLPPELQDHLRNFSSIMNKYDQPISGPDMKDLQEMMSALLSTLESLVIFGEKLVNMQSNELSVIATNFVSVTYNMGLNRGRAEARYQIERAIAQLEEEPMTDDGARTMANKALVVRTQLQSYLNTLKGDK